MLFAVVKRLFHFHTNYTLTFKLNLIGVEIIWLHLPLTVISEGYTKSAYITPMHQLALQHVFTICQLRIYLAGRLTGMQIRRWHLNLGPHANGNANQIEAGPDTVLGGLKNDCTTQELFEGMQWLFPTRADIPDKYPDGSMQRQRMCRTNLSKGTGRYITF